MINNEKVFSTRDIYLASTLITLGFDTISIDFQIEGERGLQVGYFNFDNNPELMEAQDKFWKGRVMIDPRQFITNMKGLKSQVNNEYKSPRPNVTKFKSKRY